MSVTLHSKRGAESDGFGIVEVVVSMFLLSLMAMAFLPVLVQSVQLSRSNAQIATATQLLSADLERARQSIPSCTSPPDSFEKIVDDKFTVTGQWADLGCPTSTPTTVAYTSAVSANSNTLAEAATLILVEP